MLKNIETTHVYRQGYMWSPSICACECNKNCEIEKRIKFKTEYIKHIKHISSYL